jgi:hypothetical protein
MIRAGGSQWYAYDLGQNFHATATLSRMVDRALSRTERCAQGEYRNAKERVSRVQNRSGAIIVWPHERDAKPARLLAADRPSRMTMCKTVVKANNSLSRAQSEA